MTDSFLTGDFHITKLVNSVLTKGYKRPRNSVHSGEMFHFCDGEQFDQQHMKVISLTLCYMRNTDRYYFCYTNAGSTNEIWHQMTTRPDVKDERIVKILEYILKNLDEFLRTTGDLTTINSEIINFFLDE